MRAIEDLKSAAIYCRTTASQGGFEPDDVDRLAYQAGSAMDFILDHQLKHAGTYVDDSIPTIDSIDDKESAYRLIKKEYVEGEFDAVIVRDISVIAPDDRILEKLENDGDFPLVICAEDLYYTREDFDFESFRFAHKTKEESGKSKTSTAGAQLYGYIKRWGYQSIDRKTSKVVLEMFDAARSCCNPAVIRRRLEYSRYPHQMAERSGADNL